MTEKNSHHQRRRLHLKAWLGRWGWKAPVALGQLVAFFIDLFGE